MRLIVVTLLLSCSVLISARSNAATVYKCVSPDGRTTFSQVSCGSQDSFEQVDIQVQNSGMRLAEELPTSNQSETKQAPREPRLVERTACGSDLSSQQVRKAIIEKRIFVGMSGKDAQRAWGSPTRINSNSYGAAQWVYDRGPGSTQYLYVNDADCVTAWN